MTSVGVFNCVPLFVVWRPRDDEGEITHLISARKAENHEYKAWLARYSKLAAAGAEGANRPVSGR